MAVQGKVVVKRVGEAPKVETIEFKLDSFREIVGGHIEAIPFYQVDGVWLVCNEEGKIIGLQPNFRYYDDLIVGNVFFVDGGTEDFAPLSQEQIDQLIALFR